VIEHAVTDGWNLWLAIAFNLWLAIAFFVLRRRMMPNNQALSGDHLSDDTGGTRAVVSDIPERQGVTGHNVRYVLMWGLLGAVVGLITVYLISIH
jgi:hypothetical protein